MALLGVALTGLSVVIYKQRASISLPGVAGTALATSLFTMLTTVGAANLLGVTSGERAVLSSRPHCLQQCMPV